MKSGITKNGESFRSHESYSPEEVLAAGGTTAFGLKAGKNNSTLIKALEEAPPIEPFTEEEWTDLLDQLEKDK
jgi:hypothetical protein